MAKKLCFSRLFGHNTNILKYFAKLIFDSCLGNKSRKASKKAKHIKNKTVKTLFTLQGPPPFNEKNIFPNLVSWLIRHQIV